MAKRLLCRSEKALRSRLGQSISHPQHRAAAGATASASTSQRSHMGCFSCASRSSLIAIAQQALQARHTASAASTAFCSSVTSAQQAEMGPQPTQQSPLPSSYVHLGLRQERIDQDGSLTTAYTYRKQQQVPHEASPASSFNPQVVDSQPPDSTSSGPNQHVATKQQQGSSLSRPPSLPSAAPSAAPITQQQLSQLVDLIQSHRNVLVITGAGCSTESNIPDYRGPRGAYTTGFTPMTHQQFVAKPENRARYWARSFAGWHEFSDVAANSAHEATGRLQDRGWLGMIVTQNVDRLHHKGGSRAEDVLELHGTTHRVTCLHCGANTCRHKMQQQLADLNPQMADRVRQITTAAAAAAGRGAGISNRSAYERALRVGTAADARKVQAGEQAEQVPITRPDGDVELADAGLNFKVPVCTNCGGDKLKPDVVFFGDSVPKERVDRALSAAQGSDLVLVVGSSLMVWSAFRLVKAAKEAGAKLAIVNVGPTRADDMADLKVEALAGEVMMQLAMHPNLLLPRI